MIPTERSLRQGTARVVRFHGDLATDHDSYSLNLHGRQAVTDDNLEWVFLGDDLSGKLNAHGIGWIGSHWDSTLDLAALQVVLRL